MMKKVTVMMKKLMKMLMIKQLALVMTTRAMMQILTLTS